MSEAPRSSNKAAFCFILLLCAGVGSWGYTQHTGHAPWESLLTKMSADASGDAVKSEQASSPQEVSSSLNSEPRPSEIKPEEALSQQLDAAIAGGGSPMEGGHAVEGALSGTSPAPDDRQDSVVTRGFVSDLAYWLVENYHPASAEGKSGRTSITLRKANARYSSSFTLKSAETDELKARTAILRYVYSPGMLEALFRMYSPRFMDELEKAAERSRGMQDVNRTADIFKVYAGFLRRTSSALEAASRLNVEALVQPVLRAAATEKAANEDFAKAYTAHAQARDEGRLDLMAEQSARMIQSARLASEFDSRKERARRALSWAIRQKIQGTALAEDDLIFLMEWLARHDASPEATAAAASICRRMAEDMEKRTEDLKAQKNTAPSGAESSTSDKIQ